MDKQDIRFKIELEQYEFELKYGKDFKGFIIWVAGIIALLTQGLLSGTFSANLIKWIVLILGGSAAILLVSSFLYLKKRNEFLEHIKQLTRQYENSCKNN